MSAFKTLCITRSKAIEIILTSLITFNDKELTEACNQILEKRLYNVQITDNLIDNDNDYI